MARWSGSCQRSSWRLVTLFEELRSFVFQWRTLGVVCIFSCVGVAVFFNLSHRSDQFLSLYFAPISCV